MQKKVTLIDTDIRMLRNVYTCFVSELDVSQHLEFVLKKLTSL